MGMYARVFVCWRKEFSLDLINKSMYMYFGIGSDLQCEVEIHSLLGISITVFVLWQRSWILMIGGSSVVSFHAWLGDEYKYSN